MEEESSGCYAVSADPSGLMLNRVAERDYYSLVETALWRESASAVYHGDLDRMISEIYYDKITEAFGRFTPTDRLMDIERQIRDAMHTARYPSSSDMRYEEAEELWWLRLQAPKEKLWVI